MKKFVVGMMFALLAGLFALPAVAQAQEEHGDVTVEGRGWLYAKGTGDVDIDMGGRIRLRVNGDVTITDHAGDMRVRTRGGTELAETESHEPNVVLNDFKGTVKVRGSAFTITVDGEVVLNAHGHGQAYLEGQGIYKTRNGERTVWDGMVELGDPQVQPVG